MTCNPLPGIVRIGYVPCRLIPEYLTLIAVSGVKPTLTLSLHDIALEGEATCEAEDDFDNNSHLEKATLKFKTLEVLPVDDKLAFAVETAAGDTFLIGAKEKPYPVVKRERNTGVPSGDPATVSYKVTLSTKVALVPCKIQAPAT